MSSIDVRDYWERRLAADWSLRGVGFTRLGKQLNEWQYRLRAERFASIAQSLSIDLREARVLDVGSGTGFYIDEWRHLGAEEIVGLDLTDAAVDSLRKAFPEVKFVRDDISDGTADLPPASFDIVSCMDVLFHVVDDSRYLAALTNIATLLSPGGTFVWSDFFVHGKESVEGHIAFRSLYRAEAILDRAGFDIVRREPLFYFMNEPRDTSWRLAVPAWKVGMWLASRNESIGNATGRMLYRVDRKLASRRPESPSTEVMVCRKRSN